MKKYIFLLLFGLCSFLMGKAQKENGVIYSDHEAIGKIKSMWASFVKGDKETFLSYFADTIMENSNGVIGKKLKKDVGWYVDYWKGFENFTIQDAKPAYPDALDYKEGGLWVQDWQIWNARDKATGINIKLPVHNLYSFNKSGKINSIHQYFNNDVFDELEKSTKTIEDGVVYKFHPYINTVRKLVNAYCDKDIETLMAFYLPSATFSSLSMKDGEYKNLEAQKNELKKTFANHKTINLDQTGAPICICYQNSYYVVHSWWLLSYTMEDGKTNQGIPCMLSHSFNKDGKIEWETVDVSTNHFQ